MFVFYDWPFPNTCTLQRMQPISLLILGSVFSDYVVFYGDIDNCDILSWCPYWREHTHTHTNLTALYPGLPGWAGTRKVQSIWILLKQETVGGSGIRWAICKSAPRSRQITMPAPHQSVFYRPRRIPQNMTRIFLSCWSKTYTQTQICMLNMLTTGTYT